MTMGSARGWALPDIASYEERSVLDAVLARGIGGSAAVSFANRLPPGSPLRRRLLTFFFTRGMAAINRHEHWLVPIAYEPDCVIQVAPEWSALGFLAERYEGHEGWVELNKTLWDNLADFRWHPDLLIDLGDCWVLRATLSGRGRLSQALTQQRIGTIYHLSPRGKIARQDAYWTWKEALDAAGLRASASE